MKYLIQVEINHRWYTRSQGQNNERLVRIRAKQFADNERDKRWRIVDESGSLIDLIHS